MIRHLSRALALASLAASAAAAQNPPVSGAKQPKPEDTEVWQPVPRIVTPGRTNADAPLGP